MAAVAIPAYQDYTVRSKVSELIVAGSSAKSAISEGFQTSGMDGVKAAAQAASKGVGVGTPAGTEPVSKYLKSIVVDEDTGVITLTSTDDGSLPTDAREKTITMAPYANGVALADGAEGSVEWACGTSTVVQAETRLSGLITASDDALPAKYAPSECR